MLFVPLPIYWALLAQQDSTWTFQAAQMDTRIFGITIEADQAKAMGPLILLVLIPAWQRLFIPMLRRRGYEPSALCSVAIGGICAGLSFICAGFLEQQIEGQIHTQTAAATLQPSIVLLNTTATGTISSAAMTQIAGSDEPITNISIMWQLPQFFLLMMGEILISIPGLQFSFTEAPASMKSVLTASWFINNAIGNLIVVAVTEVGPVSRQSSEYFLYAILMFMGISTFAYLASGYTYHRDDDSSAESTSECPPDVVVESPKSKQSIMENHAPEKKTNQKV